MVPRKRVTIRTSPPLSSTVDSFDQISNDRFSLSIDLIKRRQSVSDDMSDPSSLLGEDVVGVTIGPFTWERDIATLGPQCNIL